MSSSGLHGRNAIGEDEVGAGGWFNRWKPLLYSLEELNSDA